MATEKNTEKDKCGPSGDDLLSRIISRLIPDKIFGIDISCDCEEHDYNWKQHGANKHSDEILKMRIKSRFKRSKHLIIFRHKVRMPPFMGWLVGNWYYIGVRLGSVVYKLKGK